MSYVLLHHRAQPGTMVGKKPPVISSLTSPACALPNRIIIHIYVGIHKEKVFPEAYYISNIMKFFFPILCGYLHIYELQAPRWIIFIIDMNDPILSWHTPLRMFPVDRDKYRLSPGLRAMPTCCFWLEIIGCMCDTCSVLVSSALSVATSLCAFPILAIEFASNPNICVMQGMV